MVGLSVGAVSWSLYLKKSSDLEQSISRELIGTAVTGTLLIDPDQHENIFALEEGTIEALDSFESIKKTLLDIKNINNLTKPVYTFRKTPDFEETHEMEFVVMTDLNSAGNPYVGNRVLMTPYVEKVYQTGKPVATAFYTDSEGTWLSGLAPIKDDMGNVVAVLSLDQDTHFYNQALRHAQKTILATAVGSLVLGGLFLFFLTQPIIRRIRMLISGTEKISSGDLSHRINIASNDELGQLADSFNAMTDRLSSTLVSKDFVDNVIASMGEMLTVLDRNGVIQTANHATCELLGYSLDELVGKPHKMLIKDPGQEHDSQIQKSISEGSIKGLERVYLSKNGREIPVSFSSSVIRGANEIEGVVCVAQDITERKKYEEKLYNANVELIHATQAKSDFLARMSHELRTPLNAIIGYSEIMEEDAVGQAQESFVSDIRKIHSAGKHLLSLINDILDLSKIEAGKMDLYIESFEIKPVVADIASTVTPLMKKNGNKLKVVCPEGIGSMQADMTKVRQILFNLLSNASKFTENGNVSLEVERTSESDCGWITFRVSDNGIGMSPEQMENLFQEFMQADASTTRKYGGTGLGMAITKRFSEMMGGHIDVKSSQGEGTTFTVRIPDKVVKAAAVDRDLKIRGSKDDDSMKLRAGEYPVLIIDDEPSVCDLLQRFINKEGFQAICALDGKEGLRLAKEIRPIVIILDILMPDMDGWSVLSELKADSELADIPVIIHTILDEQDLGFALGASDYLTKPVNRDVLIPIIKKYCYNKTSFHIMVVEDDKDTRDMIRRMLEKEGWRVTEADNGRSALELLEAKKEPQLILLDLMMPVMDGVEFIEEFRKHEQWSSIPVIVLTAKDLTAAERQRLNGDVERILEKSTLSRDELLQELRKLMETYIGTETR